MAKKRKNGKLYTTVTKYYTLVAGEDGKYHKVTTLNRVKSDANQKNEITIKCVHPENYHSQNILSQRLINLMNRDAHR